MTAVLLPNGKQQYFTTAGAPAVGYKIATFDAGTSNPRVTWQDAGKVSPNTNPVILDARGEASIFWEGAYKVQLQDSTGAVIWTQDNLQSQPNGFAASLVPSITNTVDIGSITLSWRNLYLGANNAAILDPVSGNVGYYARTAAEVTAVVTPTAFVWPEGDIRRYGALTAAVDNSTAINNALKVSANGGSAAFIPTGTWKITSTLACVLSSSMYGVGQLSVIAPQACDGLTFTNQTVFAGSRFFRDFYINGTGTLGANRGIVALMTAASGNQINGVLFSNITIQNFLYAVYGYGYYRCTWMDCYFFNNANGFNFIEQSVKVTLVDCHVIRSPIGVVGDTSFALNCDQLGGVRPQDITARGCFFYGHDSQVNFSNILYSGLDNCDIDQSRTTGVSITTANGGCRVRNCWIDTVAASATFGVTVNALGAANHDKILIDGNHITCTTANAGSTGVSVGGNQLNVTVNDNSIGTGGGQWANGIAITGNNCIAKFNGINASSNAVSVNSSASNVEVGPNDIQAGTAQAATMTAASANIGVVSSASFPVNSPVQFSATVNGFIVGITYYVLTSAANVITVGPAPGQPSIAATGNTAVNVFVQLDPVSFTALTPPGFGLFARGSFYMAVTGFAANQFGQCFWEATGKGVILSVPAAGIPPSNQTSTTVAMTGLNLPTYLWPITQQATIFNTLDNTVGSFGIGTIASGTGIITFKKDANNTAFTAAGIKGLNGLSSPYGYT